MIVLSDLLGRRRAILAGLKHFRHRRHEVVLMHVLDPAEVDFPFESDAFSRLGRPARRIDRACALRKAYLEESEKFLRRLKQGCRQQRIDYVLVRTDQSLEVVLSTIWRREDDGQRGAVPPQARWQL